MPAYDTVSEAVNGLKERGFDLDFNIEQNFLVCRNPIVSLPPQEFKIVEFYRFEGPSDPGDEAVVYGIESNRGYKGVLVNGYGYSANEISDEMIEKLDIRRPAS